MNATREIPIISSDAGDPIALQDPNSPASVMKKAKEQEVQTGADTKFDATAPPRVEGFQSYEESKYHSIIHSLFLATSTVLFLYAAAPSS
jgi:hypothetical protein